MLRFTVPLAILATPIVAAAQSGVVVQQHTTFNVAKLSSGDLQQTMSILGTDRAKTVTFIPRCSPWIQLRFRCSVTRGARVFAVPVSFAGGASNNKPWAWPRARAGP